jgi:hypothetical protein
MCGHPLAGPLSPTVEEASPSELGIKWSPRPHSDVPGKHNSSALSEASRRAILGHLQLGDRRAGALLPYCSRKGSGKVS